MAAGERVAGVQPKLASRVRLLATGATAKNDPNGARSVAIAALTSGHPGPLATTAPIGSGPYPNETVLASPRDLVGFTAVVGARGSPADRGVLRGGMLGLAGRLSFSGLGSVTEVAFRLGTKVKIQ